MRYVYCPILPLDVEHVKDDNASTPINGGHIAERAIIENILRFSRQEVFLFPRRALAPAGDLRSSTLVAEAGNRVRFVNTQELLTGSVSRDILLFSPAWGMDHLVTLRNSIGKPSIPLVSVSHSLCSPDVISHVTLLHLSHLWSHDAFVISSRAGLDALQKMWFYTAKNLEKGLEPERMENPRFEVIPHGIDEEYFNASCNQDPNNVRFLFFGRFSTQSKADLVPLLLAWALLKKKVPTASLSIAGDDTQQRSADRLKGVIERLGCSDSIQIISNPTKAQKLDLYRTADVFVSPSDSLQETFGLTLLEAMAAGLPVIASDWSGYREIVAEGESGFLIRTLFPAMPPDDSTGFAEPFLSDISAVATSVDVDHLVDRMILLATRPDLRRSFGECGRRRTAELYSWKRVVEMYDELWDQAREKGKLFRRDQKLKKTAITISPTAVFSHYPTFNLHDGLRVSRREASEEQYVLSLACEGYPYPDELQATYRMTGATPVLVGDLCSMLLARGGIRRRSVFLHLGRLFKYNLLQYF